MPLIVKTPLELDNAATALERSLEAAVQSPRRQFLLIVEFARAIRALPPAWSRSYTLPLLQRLLLLVRHPYVTNLDPAHWRDCLELLYRPDVHAVVMQQADAEEALRAAWVRAVKDHAQAGALRPLHALLLAYRVTDTAIDDERWFDVFSAGATEYARFLAYTRVAGCGEEFVHVVDKAKAMWERVRDHAQSVSVLLVEHPVDVGTGVVLELEVLATRSSAPHFHFSNNLGDAGGATLEQLERSRRFALRTVATRLGITVPAFEIQYQFRDTAPLFGGASLGLAATVGTVAVLSQQLNGRLRWSCTPTTALVGSVDGDGGINPGPWPVMEEKLRACFFSHVETVIVPAAHWENGRALLQAMRERYPDRTLQLLGARIVEDCFRYTHAVRAATRSRTERTLRSLRMHRMLVLSSLLVLAAALAAFFAWKAWYDYPNLETTLGLAVGTNAVVYNPKDSLEWCFRDGARVVPAEVPFGDLEVGDGASRNFWIWNMTPRDRDVLLSIEGPDADEWTINWNDSLQTLPSTQALRMSVMFAPRSAGPDKRAALLLHDAESRGELTRINLMGAGGEPQPGAYAMRLDGIDDRLSYRTGSSEYVRREMTVECWVRLRSADGGVLLHNGRNMPDGQAIHDCSVSLSPGEIAFSVGSVHGRAMLDARHRLHVGTWHHIAVAHSFDAGRVRIMVDGDLVSETRGTLLFQNEASPHVTIGCWDDGGSPHDFLSADIDELRLWSRFSSAEEVRGRMKRIVRESTPDLAGYWNFDNSSEETVFCANKRAHSPEPFGRPELVRSSIPVESPRSGARLAHGSSALQGIELAPFRYLHCARNPLPRFGDATFFFRYRNDAGELPVLFSFVNNADHYIQIGPRRGIFFGSNIPLPDPPSGWISCALRSHADGETEYFVNGTLVESVQKVTNPVDRHYRFEGVQLGWFDDKYNVFSANYFDAQRRVLSTPRAFSDFRIWSRALSDAEIRALHAGAGKNPAGAVAHWPLDGPPDGFGNVYDTIGGLPMHVRSVRAWE